MRYKVGKKHRLRLTHFFVNVEEIEISEVCGEEQGFRLAMQPPPERPSYSTHQINPKRLPRGREAIEATPSLSKRRRFLPM
jgi:hypothetical protein